MERDMMYIVLLAIVMNVNGGEVSISIESDGYPSHFYNGATVNFTCTASGVDGLKTVGLGLINGTKSAGCSIGPRGGWEPVVSLSNKLDLTPPTNEYCQSTPSRSSVSIVGTVNEKMKDAQLSCFVFDGSSKEIKSEKVNVGSLRVRPMNLIMSSPEIAKRNESITFNCTSEGAIPASQFTYKVLQADQLVSTTNNYTPLPTNEGNITLECEDRIHLNLTSNVRFTKYIPLHYIDGGHDVLETLFLNPTYETILTCPVSGFPITYTWTCSGVCGSTSHKLEITMNSRHDGMNETITCKGIVAGIDEEHTQTWQIQWSNLATTTTTTGSGEETGGSGKKEKKKISAGAIIGIVVGGVVLVILIGFAIHLLRHRAGASGEEGERQPAAEQIPMTSTRQTGGNAGVSTDGKGNVSSAQ